MEVKSGTVHQLVRGGGQRFVLRGVVGGVPQLRPKTRSIHSKTPKTQSGQLPYGFEQSKIVVLCASRNAQVALVGLQRINGGVFRNIAPASLVLCLTPPQNNEYA